VIDSIDVSSLQSISTVRSGETVDKHAESTVVEGRVIELEVQHDEVTPFLRCVTFKDCEEEIYLIENQTTKFSFSINLKPLGNKSAPDHWPKIYDLKAGDAKILVLPKDFTKLWHKVIVWSTQPALKAQPQKFGVVDLKKEYEKKRGRLMVRLRDRKCELI
jgi:hypothetical protein